MQIAMIGTGYVGLVSGACFAEFGTEVTVVETDTQKLAALNEGKMPIYEPGLEQLVRENVKAGRLTFTSDLAAGVTGTEAVFIAVGTPTRRSKPNNSSKLEIASSNTAEPAEPYEPTAPSSTSPNAISGRSAPASSTTPNF